jgi:hypothetical protein
MRSKTYGVKQREAQQRKKQEELRKKSTPEVPPETDTPKADTGKRKKKDTPAKGST